MDAFLRLVVDPDLAKSDPARESLEEAVALGQLPQSIWYQRAWGTTLKLMFDGLIYACLAAGTFGWLWPKALAM